MPRDEDGRAWGEEAEGEDRRARGSTLRNSLAHPTKASLTSTGRIRARALNYDPDIYWRDTYVVSVPFFAMLSAEMTLGWAAKGAFATSNLYSFTTGDGYERVTGVDAVEERVKEEEPNAEERDGDGRSGAPQGRATVASDAPKSARGFGRTVG
ncbi:hypothetical protein OsJ_27046 [Oryza sativa Japonica Group]|uniref:Uncharacterized protein n=1 Tax=Oryza sativa subsp. japonica TaxID=39947 RepID=B9G0J5_ORYSJ|nr:hypothetical protein OsJ_27046 [Oryza sativa Japonica Group]